MRTSAITNGFYLLLVICRISFRGQESKRGGGTLDSHRRHSEVVMALGGQGDEIGSVRLLKPGACNGGG